MKTETQQVQSILTKQPISELMVFVFCLTVIVWAFWWHKATIDKLKTMV